MQLDLYAAGDLMCDLIIGPYILESFTDKDLVGWLVGCYGFNGPLRQYFSLYGPSPREGERKEKRKMKEKMSKQPPPAPSARAIDPYPTMIQISRTPRH